MITLTAKISLVGEDGGNISQIVNLPKNNVSGELNSLIDVSTQSSNPFIIGSSKVGDKSTFVSEDCGVFVGVKPSDANGNFESDDYRIVIYGRKMSLITIVFDTINNHYPTSLNIDGTEYENTKSVFTVFLDSKSSHSVIINSLNVPNYPLLISGIYMGEKIDINSRNLISLSTSIFDRSDYKLPSYGIISNVGNLEFNDNNEKIKNYAEDLILTSDLKVKITLNNTLTNKSEQVAVMETKEWTYDNDNKSVSVSLKDDLEEWQDIQVSGFNYDPRNPNAILTNRNMEDLYRWLQNESRTPSKYNMLDFDDLDSNTKSILTNTILNYPLLEDGTLWEQWTKLCEVCGLYIYKNNKGETVCSSTYGS